MSRVGKSKLKIPENIDIQESANGHVVIVNKSNKQMTLSYQVPDSFNFVKKDDFISVEPKNEEQCDRSLWGTTVRNLFHYVQGVSKPFETDVNLVGVGYKAAVEGEKIILDLGFSHKVEYQLPKEVNAKVDKQTRITFSSISKQKLGQVISEVSRYRPPEPYKGKGIIKKGLVFNRKAGKKK